jgi:tetratricopeptide (TPR) repeat protein
MLALTLLVIFTVNFGPAETLDEYITQAEEHKNDGQYDEAISIMEQAVKDYPAQAEAHAQLGIMLSEKAQHTQDFMAIISIISRAFSAWDRALEHDPRNSTARFYRGAWSVNLPKFAGKLDTGINDFEIIVAALEKSPDPSVRPRLIEAYQYLAAGYQKRAEYDKSKTIRRKIIELAPKTEYAERAQQNIDKIEEFEKWMAERARDMADNTPEIVDLEKKVAQSPGNIDLLIALGEAYYNAGSYYKAEKTLKRVVAMERSNSRAYKLLAYTLSEISAADYDPRIYMDTDFRTDLAFEVSAMLDTAVAIAPEDIDLRLVRGIGNIQMPFFVNRLEQGITDLERVIESDVPDDMKAQATYWLGCAYQKKANGYWIKVVSKYSGTEAVQDVFRAFRPPIKHVDLSEYTRPIVYIDFELSYRDELAPQSAVWIENDKGEFVKTLYISGFSGYAKEKQINLPVWAKSSEFVDVDAVTGASINLGQHIYVWDLTDHEGNKVSSGEYCVFVEVSYWPSMQYQRVEAPIMVGKNQARKVVEEGNIIPYLEVGYLP